MTKRKRCSRIGKLTFGRGAKKFLKKLWKNFEKTLDKRKSVWYNSQAAHKKGGKNRSLKIEQQEESTSIEHGEIHVCVRERNSKILREILLKQKVKSNQARIEIWPFRKKGLDTNIREFDPGSGWTLAACITHSSRTELFWLILREASRQLSGGRVSNAWATCPCVGDNVWKRTLIPHNVPELHGSGTKDLLRKDGLASD